METERRRRWKGRRSTCGPLIFSLVFSLPLVSSLISLSLLPLQQHQQQQQLCPHAPLAPDTPLIIHYLSLSVFSFKRKIFLKHSLSPCLWWRVSGEERTGTRICLRLSCVTEVEAEAEVEEPRLRSLSLSLSRQLPGGHTAASGSDREHQHEYHRIRCSKEQERMSKETVQSAVRATKKKQQQMRGTDRVSR